MRAQSAGAEAHGEPWTRHGKCPAPGAILDALHRYGFEWDGELVRQSERHDAYAPVVDRLFSMGLAYACTCSRKQLEGYHGIYPGLCRNAGHSMENAAIRVRVPRLMYSFEDRVQGLFGQHLGRDVGDFVIRRRDGLYAYKLWWYSMMPGRA